MIECRNPSQLKPKEKLFHLCSEKVNGVREWRSSWNDGRTRWEPQPFISLLGCGTTTFAINFHHHNFPFRIFPFFSFSFMLKLFKEKSEAGSENSFNYFIFKEKPFMYNVGKSFKDPSQELSLKRFLLFNSNFIYQVILRLSFHLVSSSFAVLLIKLWWMRCAQW